MAALRHAGMAVESVRPAEVTARGSRKFAAVAADGRRLFVKALGSDQRDADLLYRAARAVRLRNVGDTRPAASLFHAVEHQALVGVMAERAGVFAPGVDRVVRAGDTALLVMEWVDGCSLEHVQVTDELLVRLWAQVDKLHRAGIAHRSLRAANVMVSPEGLPRIVDFGFSELSAMPRQMDLDVAELLASLAALAGEERAVSAAAGVYYYILPELAGIGSSWRAMQSAHWIWLPVVIAFSVLTYLVRGAHLPAGHLLAAGAARLALLAHAAAPGLRLTSAACRTTMTVAASTASPSATPPAMSSGKCAPT